MSFCVENIGIIVLYIFYAFLIILLLIISCQALLFIKDFGISKIWKVDLKKFGSWAVVTGCTMGIGRAYSHELAKRGINIVLVAIGMQDLEDVSAELKQKYGVETEIIEANFMDGPEVFEAIESKLKDKDIGILGLVDVLGDWVIPNDLLQFRVKIVNNVGIGMRDLKSFNYMEKGEIWAHLAVNMGAPSYMTKIVLPIMIKNKRGAIVNLSSMSALCPMPYMATYSASKSYNRFFSDCLRHEMKSKGITVQTVTPFYVSTSMVSFSKALGKPSFIVPSPETFAASAISTLGYADSTCGYPVHQFLANVQWFVPEKIAVTMGGLIHKRLFVDESKLQNP